MYSSLVRIFTPEGNGAIFIFRFLQNYPFYNKSWFSLLKFHAAIAAIKYAIAETIVNNKKNTLCISQAINLIIILLCFLHLSINLMNLFSFEGKEILFL